MLVCDRISMMEWFKVDWKGMYPVETAQYKSAASAYGVYAIYDRKGRSNKLIYIGECYWQDFAKRLQQHKSQWLHRIKGKLYVCFGTVTLPKGRIISPERVRDVEAALIHWHIPPFNVVGRRGYHGRGVLIFNTGKSMALDPIVSDDTELMSLLRKTRRRA
jgi:hypothetical protein